MALGVHDELHVDADYPLVGQLLYCFLDLLHLFRYFANDAGILHHLHTEVVLALDAIGEVEGVVVVVLSEDVYFVLVYYIWI